MARKHHRKHTLEHELRRDPPRIANLQLPKFENKQQVHEFAERARALARSATSEPEDRRRFHPEAPNQPPRTKRGTVARMVIAGVSKPKDREAFAAYQRARRESQRFSAFASSPFAVGELHTHRSTKPRVNTRLKFKSAKHVWICLRRKMRREVMHALKIAGSRHLRQPRRNMYSDITC